jgi:hypothetical protein
MNPSGLLMPPLVLSNFQGGMRQDDDPSKLGEGEHFLMINGRVRNNKPTPVKLPAVDDTLIAGFKQGIYGAGSILAVIQDGQFYFRDFAISPSYWNTIGGFNVMDPGVSRIFAALVPDSSQNYIRIAGSSPNAGITFTDQISGTPRTVVLQDGINTPRLILNTGGTRLTNLLNQWSITNREYVPVGKQMLVHNGKLYIVSPDGKELYQSVTNRYLDFIVAIRPDGGRIIDSFFAEEASRMSHKVDYEPLSCLASLNVSPDTQFDPPFFAGTGRTSYTITPDAGRLIFGEPVFKNTILFPAGPLNQFSFIEMLGDYGFIDEGGIRSFNAIQQYGNEGKNSPFSLSVQRLFDGVTQTDPCAASFDNYGLFAVNTIYGHGILVYDLVTKKFVSLDIYPGIGQIKQFAEIKVGTTKRLFFITETALYEAFAGNTATMQFFPREWATLDKRYEHRLSSVRVSLRNITSAGTLVVKSFQDEEAGPELSQTLIASSTIQTNPRSIPYGTQTQDGVREIEFPFSTATRCKKFGVMVALDAPCEIIDIQCQSEVFGVKNVTEEKALIYG